MPAHPFPFKSFYPVLGVVLAVHLAFFVFALIQKPRPLPDSHEYLQAASNLYQEGTLYAGDLSEPLREEAFTRRPPLYPLFLGFALFAGSIVPVLLLQMALSMLSIVLIYSMFINNAKIAWLPLLLLLMTPAQFIYTNLVMAEIPFQFILVLMLWCIYRYSESPSPGKYIWLFNLLLTLGMAAKPVLFPFAIAWVVISVVAFIRQRKAVFLLALLLPFAWISAYTMRNYSKTESMQYSSIQTTNMLNYNLRYFIMASEGKQAADKKVDDIYKLCEEESSFKLQNKCLQEGARGVILEHPLKYAWFHIKGSLRFFLDPGRYDLVKFFKVQKGDAPGFLYHLNEHGLKGIPGFLKLQGPMIVGMLALIFLFKVIKIIGLLLYLFKGTHPALVRWLLAGLVLYLALITGPLGASRFILPVELLIIGAAAQGWILYLSKRGLLATTYPES